MLASRFAAASSGSNAARQTRSRAVRYSHAAAKVATRIRADSASSAAPPGTMRAFMAEPRAWVVSLGHCRARWPWAWQSVQKLVAARDGRPGCGAPAGNAKPEVSSRYESGHRWVRRWQGLGVWRGHSLTKAVSRRIFVKTFSQNVFCFCFSKMAAQTQANEEKSLPFTRARPRLD